jgi:hypothetical protein
MATTLDIVNSISQVLSNTYDGALDENGDPVKIGLRREEGNPLLDSRIMDGFGAYVSGDRLHIKYHAEIPLKEVHGNSFESDTESLVENIKSFIQKEYKKLKKSALSLTDSSEVDILVEYISRIRCSVKAHKCWKIGGVGSENNTPESEPVKPAPEFEKINKLAGLNS